jgi:8-oxo-dGTP pyrophosphatase MutT (NUDIX family)
MVPGGGLHPKEDPKIAAIREISEELHIVVEKTQLQPLGIFHQTKGHPYTFHGYAVVLDAKPVLKVRTSEINAARWVPVSKLSNLYTDQHVQLLLDTWRKQR